MLLQDIVLICYLSSLFSFYSCSRSRDAASSEASASASTLLSQSPYAAAVRTATQQQQQQQQRSSRWSASPSNTASKANRSRPSSTDSAASTAHTAAAVSNVSSILSTSSVHRRQQTAVQTSSKDAQKKRQAHRRSKTARTSSAAAATVGAAVMSKQTAAAVYSDDTNSLSPQAAAATETATVSVTTAGTPLLLPVTAAVQIDSTVEHTAELTDYIPHDIVIPKCNLAKLKKRLSDSSRTHSHAAVAETSAKAAAAIHRDTELPLDRKQHECCGHTFSDSSCSRCSSNNSSNSSLSNSISRIPPAVAAVHNGVDDDISLGNSDVLLQVSGNASAFDVSGSYGFTDSNNSCHYNSSSNVIRLDGFTIDETGYIHTANTSSTAQQQHSVNSADVTQTSVCRSTQSNEQQLSASIVNSTEAVAIAYTTAGTANGGATVSAVLNNTNAAVKQQGTYIRQQVLGRGSSGIVYKAFHVPTLTLVAQKVSRQLMACISCILCIVREFYACALELKFDLFCLLCMHR
jgi:hypothetical protein